MDRPGAAIANAVVVSCSLIALSTRFADERAQTFGELGAWLVAPEKAGAINREVANDPNATSDPDAASHATCPLNLTPSGAVDVRISIRTRSRRRVPDDARAELAGSWRQYSRALDAHEPRVRLELVCGTASATALDFFQSSWLPLRAAEPPALACPDDKPLLLAARCQTVTMRPLQVATQ